VLTGHFAASLALKSYNKPILLLVLFAVSQLVDIFFMLLLLGVESLRIVPDINPSNDLDLYYSPFTHGLLITPLWILGFLGMYAIKNKINRSIIYILALAVASHWLFDLFTHTADLPIVGNHIKLSFGLWNYPAASIALEALFITIGSWIYLKNTNDLSLTKFKSVLALAVLLIIPPAVGPLLSTPSSAHEVAISGLSMYTFFKALTYMVDRFE